MLPKLLVSRSGPPDYNNSFSVDSTCHRSPGLALLLGIVVCLSCWEILSSNSKVLGERPVCSVACPLFPMPACCLQIGWRVLSTANAQDFSCHSSWLWLTEEKALPSVFSASNCKCLRSTPQVSEQTAPVLPYQLAVFCFNFLAGQRRGAASEEPSADDNLQCFNALMTVS